LKKNLEGLSEINGIWVTKAMEKTPHHRIILDMNSSESKVRNMKKYLFILLSLILVSAAYSQEFKLIGGISFSNYNVWPEVISFPFDLCWIEYNYKCNYNNRYLVGGGVEFDLSRKLAFEIDILYFQKGSNIQDRYLSRLKWNYVLNVISTPMLVKVSLYPDTSPYVLVGCDFSIVLSHKEKLIVEEEEYYEEDIKANTKGFDFGLVFGAGFEIKIQVISLFIEARYYLGLKNIIKDYWPFESINTKSGVILIGLKI